MAAAVEWVHAEVPRGEWVIVVRGAEPVTAGEATGAVADALGAALDAGLDRRTAVAQVAKALAVPKRQVYDAALAMPWPQH
jgi:16S rRNA (cytidine1402-2'-O)-methyltransferase